MGAPQPARHIRGPVKYSYRKLTSSSAGKRVGGNFGNDGTNARIEHWVGAAFLQNATLDGVLPRLRNYNNRSRYMMPEIIASRLTDHHGNVFQVYLRLVEADDFKSRTAEPL